MLKREKERIVADLAERLRSSETLIVADYRGLSMTDIDAVRTELLQHGARFSVVKNTLTKRAADTAGVAGLNEFLEGPTAIAFVADGDMIAVAKALNETARRTRVLALKGGILQGRTLGADDVRELASLPPVDVLRGQVLGAIVAPLNAIAALVNAPLQDFVGLLDARMEQLRERGEEREGEAQAPPVEAAQGAENVDTEGQADAAAGPGEETDKEEE